MLAPTWVNHNRVALRKMAITKNMITMWYPDLNHHFSQGEAQAVDQSPHRFLNYQTSTIDSHWKNLLMQSRCTDEDVVVPPPASLLVSSWTKKHDIHTYLKCPHLNSSFPCLKLGANLHHHDMGPTQSNNNVSPLPIHFIPPSNNQLPHHHILAKGHGPILDLAQVKWQLSQASAVHSNALQMLSAMPNLL